jgi:signal transduction histidine kinase
LGRAHAVTALTAAIVLTAIAGVRAAAQTPFEVHLDDPRMLAQAELAISDSTVPPAAADWVAVTLPEDWRAETRYRLGQQGWYRFSLGHRAPPDESWSVYLWRFSMNAEVFMNGELIGTGGSFDEPITRNWNRPLLFAIPATLWRDTGNEVQVRLRVYPGFGNMMPIAVGPTAALRPDYETRFFRQITLGQASTLLTLCIAVIALAFWIVNRSETAYLYFALSSLAWSAYTLNLHIQSIPVSSSVWWSAMHLSLDAFAVFLVLFAHRLFAVQRPRLERAIVAFMVACVACYSIWDLPAIARYSNITHMVTTALGLYLALWIAARAIRHPSIDSIVFAASMFAVVSLAVHDLLLSTRTVPGMWRTQSYMVQFAAPLMFAVMIVHLTGRFRRALVQIKHHNIELRERVAETTRSLEDSFRERQELERQQAIALERERIYRDLHDDVGAKVLTLIYSASTEHEASLARGVMSELRSIVSTGHFEGGALGEISATMRAETQRRCDAAGLRLDWLEAGDGRLSAHQHYQVQRILRELVSNVIEHSHGSAVAVALEANERILTLTVSDDGAGIVAASTANGHGLSGIRQRVTEMAGSVEWTVAEPRGTRCRVSVPLPPDQGV